MMPEAQKSVDSDAGISELATGGGTETLPATLAILGAGKMGGILLSAFLKAKLFTADRITATVAHQASAQALSSRLGVRCSTDNLAAAQGADIPHPGREADAGG